LSVIGAVVKRQAFRNGQHRANTTKHFPSVSKTSAVTRYKYTLPGQKMFFKQVKRCFTQQPPRRTDCSYVNR
jgi:hypothetical protein